MNKVTLLSFNIHKGFSALNRRAMLPHLRERIRERRADLVLLQEAVGHRAGVLPDETHPGQPQYEYLAEGIWPEFAYGKNAVTENSHHGNAILSRYPILDWKNFDISTNGLEHRGLLLSRIQVPGAEHDLYCLCTHLDLTAMGRRQQYLSIQRIIEAHVPPQAPLVLGGDFNDWSEEAETRLAQPLGLTEVFRHTTGRCARTFPAVFPMLRLDRFYVRGLRIRMAQSLTNQAWRRLSDHIAIAAELSWD